jgi:EmrB/QacA subfamily drug resistance transporter
MKLKQNNGTGLILFTLSVGTFMSALDTSAVTVATRAIQAAFASSLSQAEWVITAYLLVISSLLLTFGRLADLKGHKKLYTTGFAIFTAGSLACGISSGIGALVASRVIQALGAAMMFSSSSAIITDCIPEAKRGKAFGIVAVAVAVACCVGPVAGGILVGTLGWRSVFFINVPVGIAGTILAIRNIPADKAQKKRRFDGIGAILAFFALLLILLPLDLSASNGFPLPVFALLLGAGFALVTLFVLWEGKTRDPMLSLSLFRNRVFSASLAAAVFNYAAQFMMAFLAPYYFQKIRILSPVMTGLLFLPMPLATILIAPISGSFSDRHDSRILSSAGMGTMALGLCMLAFVDTGTPYWYIVVCMALAGAGSGMFQSPNSSAIMGSVPVDQRGAASGTLATVRNIGMVVGVALSGAFFGAGTARATKALSLCGISGIELSDRAATSGLRVTFLAATASAILAMTASLAKGNTAKRNTPDIEAPELVSSGV